MRYNESVRTIWRSCDINIVRAPVTRATTLFVTAHPPIQQSSSKELAKGWPNVSKCDWWSKPHPPAQVQWTRTTTTGGGIVISHPEKINAPLEQRERLLTNHNNILSSTWLIYRGVDGRCSHTVQPTESQSEPTPTRISLEPLVGLGRPNTHTHIPPYCSENTHPFISFWVPVTYCTQTALHNAWM